MAAVYGHIRVSSREQNEDRQVIALGEVGVSGKMIYMDKQGDPLWTVPETPCRKTSTRTTSGGKAERSLALRQPKPAECR